MKRQLILGCLVLCLSTAVFASLDRPLGLILDRDAGLAWISDPLYAANTGAGKSPIMSPRQARQFIKAMNSGDLPNLGYGDWRPATTQELVRIAETAGGLRGIERLRDYLAAKGAISSVGHFGPRPGKTIDDTVFVWPVRAQISGQSISDVALLATNSMHLQQNSDLLSGDAVVNAASPGPYLSDGRELVVGIGVTTSASSRIVGDSIKIKNNGVVNGDIFYNDIDNNGTINGTQNSPLSLPVFATLPAFIAESPRPEAEDVEVPIGGSVVLPPGDYGVLVVKLNGTATFTGGVYNFREIDSRESTKLLFQAPSEVRVEGKFSADQNSYVGSEDGFLAGGPPFAPMVPLASEIIFYVAGINGNNGNLGATPKAAKVGISADVFANFHVPNGTLHLRQNTSATGAFIARDVDVGIGTQVTLDSFSTNKPPVADPQIVETNGAGQLEITLTGSDPEGKDLVFSIEADPTAGTVTDPVPIVPDPIPEIDQETGLPTGGFVQPPIVSATVIYQPNDPGANAQDSFIFKVTDTGGLMGSAEVEINPPPEVPDTPPELEDVRAIPDTHEALLSQAITIVLQGDAPCDEEDPQTGECTSGVSLSFAIEENCTTTACTSPSSGILSNLTPDGQAVSRTASVLYTPTASQGATDAFEFEVCGTLPEPAGFSCDRAIITVILDSQAPLAQNQQVVTDRNTPVSVLLTGNSGGAGEGGGSGSIVLRARPTLRDSTIEGARIAGNVGDSNDDGLGDSSNNLPGPAPVLISAGVDLSGQVSGVVRIQIEFDIRGLPQSIPSESIESAEVTLTTEKGTVDSLDTFFFVGFVGGDGLLSPSDFETATVLSEFPPFNVSTMPVPAGAQTGDEGTHQFDVTGAVRDAIANGFDFMVIQGRVNENLAGGGSQRGLQIHSTADGNLALGKEPQLEVTTPDNIPLPLRFTVLTLPANGTLTHLGEPVVAGQRFFQVTTLLFSPGLNFAGSDSFQFEVAQGLVAATAQVDITINPTDNCEANGRPVGCAPFGGQ